MNIQRLRNLTTGKLHTKMEHIYQDTEWLTGSEGIMTHHLPNARDAMLPYLREKTIFLHPRLWDGSYDTEHQGEIDIKPMNETERKEYWERYQELPSLLAG